MKKSLVLKVCVKVYKELALLRLLELFSLKMKKKIQILLNCHLDLQEQNTSIEENTNKTK